jgi:hypothetical protein
LPRHTLSTRQKNGEWQDPVIEVVYLIASLPVGEAAPEALLSPLCDGPARRLQADALKALCAWQK